MMLGPLGWLSTIGLPFAFGLAILRIVGIRYRDDRLAVPAWAWMVGAFGTGLFVLLACLIGLPLDARILAPVLALLTAGLFFLARRRETPPPLDITPRGSWFGTPVLVLVLMGTVYCSLTDSIDGNDKIVILGDEANIWAAKAKAVHAAGGLNEEFRERTGRRAPVYHKDYPLLNPMLQVWVFAHAGEITQVANRIPMQLFMIAMLLALAAALRRQVHPLVAAALLFVLATTLPMMRFLAQWAYADHMVAMGFLVMIDAWWLRRRTRDDRAFVLLMMAIGFTLWSKNEGLLLLVAGGGAALIALGARWKRRELQPVRGLRWSWIALPIGIMVAHRAINSHFGFENDLQTHGLNELIRDQFGDRWRIVLTAVFNEALWADAVNFELIPNWPEDRGFFSSLWAWLGDTGAVLPKMGSLPDKKLPFASNLLIGLSWAAMLLFPIRLLKSRAGAPMLALLAVTLGFFLVYVGSFQEIRWHIHTSLYRVFFDIVPATALWLAAALAVIFPKLDAFDDPAAPIAEPANEDLS